MAVDELHWLGVAQAGELIRRSEVSPVEIVEDTLAWIQKTRPRISRGSHGSSSAPAGALAFGLGAHPFSVPRARWATAGRAPVIAEDDHNTTA